LAGNDHHCVLALIHHDNDPYTSANTSTDQNSIHERKAAHKNLKVLQFLGTPPAPPPLVVPFRLHAETLKEKSISSLRISLRRYPGHARFFLPRIETKNGDIHESIEGIFADEDFSDFKNWAQKQNKLVESNLKTKEHYNKDWSHQRLEDIEAALEHGVMFTAGGKRDVLFRDLILEPTRHYTAFLVLDRPKEAKIGESFDIDIVQFEEKEKRVLGGLDLRVEIQAEPKAPKIPPESFLT